MVCWKSPKTDCCTPIRTLVWLKHSSGGFVSPPQNNQKQIKNNNPKTTTTKNKQTKTTQDKTKKTKQNKTKKIYVADKPSCYCFSTKLKPQDSAKQKCWACIRIAEAPCFGWSKRPYMVHSQHALCFVAFTTAPKASSWSETTLR